MTDHEKSTLFALSFAAILNVVLNLILIPKLGMMGAAIATSTSVVSWNIILCVMTWRHLGIIAGPILFLSRSKDNDPE
jgi:O-antigen/teichoic acid export membrane protein